MVLRRLRAAEDGGEAVREPGRGLALDVPSSRQWDEVAAWRAGFEGAVSRERGPGAPGAGALLEGCGLGEGGGVVIVCCADEGGAAAVEVSWRGGGDVEKGHGEWESECDGGGGGGGGELPGVL